MKSIASAADQLAFQLAIGQAEAALGDAERPAEALDRSSGAQRAPKAPGQPQEASQGRQRLPDGVGIVERWKARLRRLA